MLQQHEMEIRVRYCETDAMGFLHHANYFNLFEVGRTELYRAQGGDYRALEAQGIYFVVAKLTCTYRAPARYDDVLRLRTTLANISPAKLEHDYELFRGNDTLAVAHSVLACVNREGRPIRIPDVIPGYSSR
jgi:acyl-CoA thioester hydrolase